MFTWNFLCLIMPIASHPVTRQHWEGTGSISILSFNHYVFLHLEKIPCALSSSGWAVSALSASHHTRAVMYTQPFYNVSCTAGIYLFINACLQNMGISLTYQYTCVPLAQ